MNAAAARAGAGPSAAGPVALALPPAAPATVAFGGGCFYNRVLAADLRRRLEAAGLSVIYPAHLGSGDPAIGLGQACAAAFAPEPTGKERAISCV